ncbi:MAG: hypothetical protein KAV87_40645 [Desulfobacteraceae bacterium]|nr:hypothetical protein [Desulfobacteraceae bacterium]
MDEGIVLIVTNRLQPLHRGHLLFWKEICNRFSQQLIICVLRDIQRFAGIDTDGSEYERKARWTMLKEQNPLPQELRFELAWRVVRNDTVLVNRAKVLLRVHPLLDWDKSLEGLPENRVWVFNRTKSDFDASKIDFYHQKGEEVIVLECGDYGYSARHIRQRLAIGERDVSFLPEECRKLFKSKCIQYFNKALRKTRRQ